METYNGTYLTLLVESTPGNYKPMAQAKDHTVSIVRAAVDGSTKSTGDSTAKDPGRYSLSVSVDALVSYETGVINLATLRSMMLAGTKFKMLSALLDFETAGVAPLDDTAEIAITDTGDDGVIDSDTTEIEADGNELASTDVMADMDPTVIYFQAVITGVDENSSDGEKVSFSASFESDGDYQILDTAEAGTYSAAFQAVYDDWTNKPAAGVATAMNTMVQAIIDAGVWAKLYAFVLTAAHSNDDDEALLNWVDLGTYDAVLSGGTPTFTAYEGFQRGTGLIETNFIPSVDADSVNSLSIGAYIRSDVDEATTIMGCNDATNTVYIQPRRSGNMRIAVNCSPDDRGVVATSLGMFVASRTGAAAQVAYQNGAAIVSGTDAAVGLPTVELYALCQNNNGSPTSLSTNQISCYFIGEGLDITEVAAITNAVEAYMDSNGNGVIT